MAAKRAFGIERAYGNMYFAQGGFTRKKDYLAFTESQDVANQTLHQAIQYSEVVAEVISSSTIRL